VFIWKNRKLPTLKYSYINNSILLSTETIEKNGFKEIYRQVNDDTYSIQILCFNEETREFKAFDRFHWMDEPYYSEGGSWGEIRGVHYKKDLWTPIALHYTSEWLKKLFKI